MTPDGGGSVTCWIDGVKAGDAAATQKLWERYFESLVRLAQAKLRTAHRAAEDEEDAALSAFDSFCTAAATGRFPKLGDRDDLWHILVALTRRKALDQIRRQKRQKRGGGNVATAATLGAPGELAGILDEMVGPEPTAEFAAMVADECRVRLASLRDDSLRQVALMRMEGYSNEEIAVRLDCGLRTLTRKLDLIRRTWTEGQNS